MCRILVSDNDPAGHQLLTLGRDNTASATNRSKTPKLTRLWLLKRRTDKALPHACAESSESSSSVRCFQGDLRRERDTRAGMLGCGLGAGKGGANPVPVHPA